MKTQLFNLTTLSFPILAADWVNSSGVLDFNKLNEWFKDSSDKLRPNKSGALLAVINNRVEPVAIPANLKSTVSWTNLVFDLFFLLPNWMKLDEIWNCTLEWLRTWIFIGFFVWGLLIKID